MLRACMLTLLATFAVSTTGTAQSAEEQVQQAVLTFYQRLADHDAAGWNSMISRNSAGNFARTGALLAEGNAAGAAGMQASFDSGQLDYQLTVRHLDVTVYGNTAVATFYTTGPSVVNGSQIFGTFRVSQVWVREGQTWRAVHWHISPLVS